MLKLLLNQLLILWTFCLNSSVFLCCMYEDLLFNLSYDLSIYCAIRVITSAPENWKRWGGSSARHWQKWEVVIQKPVSRHYSQRPVIKTGFWLEYLGCRMLVIQVRSRICMCQVSTWVIGHSQQINRWLLDLSLSACEHKLFSHFVMIAVFFLILSAKYLLHCTSCVHHVHILYMSYVHPVHIIYFVLYISCVHAV